MRTRTQDLEDALALAGDRLDPEVAAQVRDAVGGVRERLALGVDHTVVALAGGTGSGKSSLFNSVSRLDFADVGVRRPTTALVTACSWSAAATALLDWLDVEQDRRITRGGELDGDDESALAGLVLLDLPDHDSIAPEHRAVVDRVLPLVDLLVWVVDPQKYADDALHSGYLRKSSGLEGSMVVALNQIDTVPGSRRESLVQDMDRLLTEDGLTGVYVTTVSARTGEGMDELRSLLEQAVARRSVAASRVAGELDRAGALLLAETPGEVPWTMSTAVEQEVDSLVEVSGLGGVAGQVGAAVRNGYGRPELSPVSAEAVALSRARWLTRAGRALRPGWRRSLDRAVTPASGIAREVSTALARIPLDTRGPSSARPTRRAAWVALGLGVVAAVLAVLGSLDVVPLSRPLLTTCAVVAAVAVVTAVVCFLVVLQLRRTLGRRRRQQVFASGRGAIERVVRETMAAPTQELLDAHRRVRELAQSARDRDPAAPLTGALRLPTGPDLDASSTGEGGPSDTDAVRPAP
nr:ABC transporter [Cellulosimicrobium arenosum]